jgi:hypothetical protein
MLKRFHHFEPICPLQESSHCCKMSEWNDDNRERDRLLSTQCTSQFLQPLSVSYKDIDISQFLYEDMWYKVAKLVNIEGGIVKASLSENSWLVASLSRNKPNHVVKTKESSFTCDCSGYHEESICYYTLLLQSQKVIYTQCWKSS